MCQYPDVAEQPANEPWLEQDAWSFQRVFSDLYNWKYDDPAKAQTCREHWAALRAWHTAYSTSDSVQLGALQDLAGGLQLGGVPACSWQQMWDLLDARAARAAAAEITAPAPQPSASAPNAAEARRANARKLKGNARREAMSRSTRLSELNIVSFPGCTEADASRMRLEEDAETYVKDNLEVRP